MRLYLEVLEESRVRDRGRLDAVAHRRGRVGFALGSRGVQRGPARLWNCLVDCSPRQRMRELDNGSFAPIVEAYKSTRRSIVERLQRRFDSPDIDHGVQARAYSQHRRGFDHGSGIWRAARELLPHELGV